MQDGTWSAIVPEPTLALTPDPTLSPPHNKMDTYLEEMPENAGNTNVLLEPMTLAHIVSTSAHVNHVISELYDSGDTRHMTPYKVLINYTVIMPKPINAANQHTFCVKIWTCSLSICSSQFYSFLFFFYLHSSQFLLM